MTVSFTLPKGIINIGNVQSFLKTQCQFDCQLENNTFIFNPSNSINYFELVKLSEGDETLDSNIANVINWLESYPEQNPYRLTPEQLTNFEQKYNNGNNERKRQLNIILNHLFAASNNQIASLISDLILPKFNKIFPEGSIWFLKTDYLLNLRLAAIRALYSLKEVPEVVNSSPQDFVGFNTLRYLHQSFLLGCEEFLNPFFTIFPPFMTGCLTERFGGSFIFIFGETVNYLSPFPWRLQDLVYHTYYFSEHRKREIKDVKWGRENISTLLQDYINGLQNFFSCLLDPTNFGNNSNEIDLERWFFTNLTLERIANEVTMIQTEFMNSYLKKTLFLGIIDKLGELVSQRRGTNATKIFKDLLRQNNLHKIAQILRNKYKDPLGNFFANGCKRTIDELYQSVIKGIFVPQRKVGDDIILTPRNKPQERCKTEDYVVSFLRGIRNTQHGFLINKPEYLTINDGNISDQMPNLSTYFWLALIQQPDIFIEGKIV